MLSLSLPLLEFFIFNLSASTVTLTQGFENNWRDVVRGKILQDLSLSGFKTTIKD
jgi:hypothetical protein